MKSRFLAYTVMFAAAATALSGCSSHNAEDIAEINSLKTKLAKLEQENEQLKQKASGVEAMKYLMSAVSRTEQPQPRPAALYGGSENLGGSVSAQPQTQSQPAPLSESTAQSQATPAKITDLDETPQRPMIEELVQLGVVPTDGNHFNPDKPITRGEYVTWLFKAYNAIMPLDKQLHLAPSAEPFFKDVSASEPCYKYVQALANAGYSIGYEDKTFRPDKPLTREEMIGMKVGLDCGKSFEPYRSQMAYVWKFSDSQQIDNRFTGYIHQDYYVSGDYGSNIQRAFGKVGTFRPKAAVTRAEAAGTLWQMGQFGMHGYTAGAAVKAKLAHS